MAQAGYFTVRMASREDEAVRSLTTTNTGIHFSGRTMGISTGNNNSGMNRSSGGANQLSQGRRPFSTTNTHALNMSDNCGLPGPRNDQDHSSTRQGRAARQLLPLPQTRSLYG
jgi:hypothetical protein